MTGTKNRGWTALLAGALLAFPGCGVEPATELDEDESALADAESLPLEVSRDMRFDHDPELTSQPNIIVVMLDDLDVASFEQLMSDPQLLPNIRTHLVSAGVSFSESFVSNAVCCPSRVTFLTGQYSHNSGTQALGGTNGGYTSFVPRQNDALATWLQNAGYHTGHVGKYLNGYNEAASATVPSGWNEWHALIDPSTYNVDSFNIRERYVNGGAGGPLVDGIQSSVGGVSGSGYQTDVLASRTQDIITRWQAYASHKPLFVEVMPTAPHVEVKPCWDKELNHAGQFNLEIRPKGWNGNGTASLHYGLLRARTSEGKVNDFAPRSAAFELPSLGTAAFDEEDIADKPRYLRDGYPAYPGSGWPRLASTTVCDVPFDATVTCSPWPPQDCTAVGGQTRSLRDALQRQHLGRLESMLSVDDMVGTIVGALSAAELDNTVFIFTSDNGYLLGEHRLVNKQQPYEESIRVPLVIRPPAGSTVARGSSHGSMVVNTDVPATILDYAGVQAGAMPLDGRSLKDILQGTATSLARRRLLVEHFFSRPNIAFWDVPDYFGVRTAVSAGSVGAHSTFVEYHADGASWDGRNTGREYYKLGSDPMQIASRHDDASTAEERLILSEHLAALRYCRGATCTQAEDRPDFTSRQFLPVVTANSPDPGHPAFFHPGAKHHSGIVIHNPSSTTADALLLIYGAVDDFSLAESLTLAPGEARVIQPSALTGLPLDFVGSATVASSVPLTVVVNTTNRLYGAVGVSGGNSAAQYVGIDASRTASTLRVPLVKKMHAGSKNTAVYLQNAGAVATSITATFVPAGSSTPYTLVLSGVAPRKVVAVRPQDVPGLSDGLSAATFTSSGGVPLAGVSWEYEVQATGAPISPAQRLQATNAFADTGVFRDAGTTIHFPVVKRKLGGKTTGHQVQNASSQSLRVQITYHRSARCPALANGPLSQQTPAELAPGESYTFYDWAGLGDSCLTSATATAVNGSAGSYLVGVASERCNDTTLCRNTLTTYSAIASHRATTTLVAPLFKEEVGGKQTGLAVHNTSTTAAATVTASFRRGGATYTCTKSIPALGLIVFHDMTNTTEWTSCWDNQFALPANSLAAVTVTASQPIVGVVNEEDLTGTQDDANYEAINR